MQLVRIRPLSSCEDLGLRLRVSKRSIGSTEGKIRLVIGVVEDERPGKRPSERLCFAQTSIL